MSRSSTETPERHPEPPQRSPADIARGLIRTAMSATLATRDRDARDGDGEAIDAGFPLATLVAVGTLHDNRPLLLISGLARHARNLARDSRCSLLFADPAGATLGDPLTLPRVTVVGRLHRISAPIDVVVARRRFVSRHVGARQYADFGDFGFWCLEPARAHLVAGFGRIVDVAITDLLDANCAKAAALLDAEDEILSHMAADHADVVDLYGASLGVSHPGAESGQWRIAGLDREGFDLVSGQRTGRIKWPFPVEKPDDARRAFIEIGRRLRSASGH